MGKDPGERGSRPNVVALGFTSVRNQGRVLRTGHEPGQPIKREVADLRNVVQVTIKVVFLGIWVLKPMDPWSVGIDAKT